MALTDALGFQLGFQRLARIRDHNTTVPHYWFKEPFHGSAMRILARVDADLQMIRT
jgi:hypothetical protein